MPAAKACGVARNSVKKDRPLQNKSVMLNETRIPMIRLSTANVPFSMTQKSNSVTNSTARSRTLYFSSFWVDNNESPYQNNYPGQTEKMRGRKHLRL